jgi:hypothetical protein
MAQDTTAWSVSKARCHGTPNHHVKRLGLLDSVTRRGAAIDKHTWLHGDPQPADSIAEAPRMRSQASYQCRANHWDLRFVAEEVHRVAQDAEDVIAVAFVICTLHTTLRVLLDECWRCSTVLRPAPITSLYLVRSSSTCTEEVKTRIGRAASVALSCRAHAIVTASTVTTTSRMLIVDRIARRVYSVFYLKNVPLFFFQIINQKKEN